MAKRPIYQFRATVTGRNQSHVHVRLSSRVWGTETWTTLGNLTFTPEEWERYRRDHLRHVHVEDRGMGNKLSPRKGDMLVVPTETGPTVYTITNVDPDKPFDHVRIGFTSYYHPEYEEYRVFTNPVISDGLVHWHALRLVATKAREK